MLKPLSIEEAVDGVINLQSLGEFATAIIPPVPTPTPGDEADVFIGEPAELLGVIALDPESGGVFQIPKNVLLNYSGNGDTPFSYVFYMGGGGNEEPSEKVFYKIVLAVEK